MSERTGSGARGRSASGGRSRTGSRRTRRISWTAWGRWPPASGGDEIVPLLLLEVSQILLAGAQLGASKDVILPGNWEPEVGADPDLDALRTGLAGGWPRRRVRRAVRPVHGHPA